MLRVFSRVTLFAAALAAVGCGSTVVVAPPPADGGVVCRFPDGRECRQGQSCASPDGCNTCACSADGALACTLRACIDGGPPDVPTPRTPCRSNADCTNGEQCLIAEGCATTSYCDPGPRVCTGDVAPFCGCSGATFYASSTCPTQPYARRGACEAVDGGASPCRFPSGRLCPFGQRCPADDGCNTCVCTPLGFSCTEIACFDAGAPDGGGTCSSSADCPPSSMCQGEQGCGVPWRCVPVTGCTPDIARFCGCDGVTFEGSSSCPGRPYRALGRCPVADGGVACAAMDAHGEGACDGYFGVAWDGSACVSVNGCRCVGADCGRVFRDRAACVATCGG